MSLAIGTPKSSQTTKVPNLIKCEDQSQMQAAILNNLTSFKRRKAGGGQRLKPLSSGNELTPISGNRKVIQQKDTVSHNNYSLIESEAKLECFNFTFNPKDETTTEPAEEVDGPSLDQLKLAKHLSTGQKPTEEILDSYSRQKSEQAMTKQGSQKSIPDKKTCHSSSLQNPRHQARIQGSTLSQKSENTDKAFLSQQVPSSASPQNNQTTS